jgi:uncharacterized protein YndB with AHSA1/START domain
MTINPKLDIVLKKELDLASELVWKAWTTPELICKWFCPEPWKVIEARLDLRPGGIFSTVMQSPEGEKFPGTGCILEVIPQKKLVWTSTLLPDFRPADTKDFTFTCVITLEGHGDKTSFTAIAMHKSEEDRQKHVEMGFEQGWSICADQLVKVMK